MSNEQFIILIILIVACTGGIEALIAGVLMAAFGAALWYGFLFAAGATLLAFEEPPRLAAWEAPRDYCIATVTSGGERYLMRVSEEQYIGWKKTKPYGVEVFQPDCANGKEM